MPRALSDYSLDDWRRLRPLFQFLKMRRYRAVDRRYRRQPARVGDARALAALLGGRNVLVTIAFADPVVLTWQARLVRHYVPNAFHIIVDNSPGERQAAEVRYAAQAEGVSYLRAPPNPWSGRAASRSHGLALNWTWHNVIRPGQPAAFGFIDHDLFPTAPDDPFAPLARQDVYGQVRRIESRWFLWAGFCMFRFDRVRHKALDFGQDWFIGLDTGGANWDPLYSSMDLAAMDEAQTSFFPFRSDIEVSEGPLQWCGTWLHEVGLMGRPELCDEKRRTVAMMLEPHLAATIAPAETREPAAVA